MRWMVTEKSAACAWMTAAWRKTAPTALLLGALGCVPEDAEGGGEDPSLDTLSQGIQSGAVDSQRTAVVGMYTFQGQYGGICSGTLIAPNLVLTAQHCIAQLSSSYINCSTSRFGAKNAASNIFITTTTSLTNNSNDYYGVSEVVVPSGSTSVCGNDIALLILNRNVSASIATPITPRLDEPVRRLERYTAVGYGHTGQGSGSGTRRSIGDRIIQCGGINPCPSYAATIQEMVSYDSNTCQGDSGGAALDQQGRLLATLSRGGADPNNTSNTCYSSVHVTVASWSVWIREHAIRAAQSGQYAPPSWVGNSTLLDNDFDGFDNDLDNCVEIPNVDQRDFDNDGLGDVCDQDLDGDGIDNDADNCSLIANADQLDLDKDGYGDLCDNDDDNDGLLDDNDNCPSTPNARQRDFDDDTFGDLCDEDDDNDGVKDVVDECPLQVDPCQVTPDPEEVDDRDQPVDLVDPEENPSLGTIPKEEVKEEEEPFIIIIEEDPHANDSGPCSTAQLPAAPARAPAGALLGLLGFALLRRRRG